MTINELLDAVEVQGDVLVKVWDEDGGSYVAEKSVGEFKHDSAVRDKAQIMYMYQQNDALVIEVPVPEFEVKVTSITTISVNAIDEETAKDIACGKAWEFDAEEQEAEIV